MCLIGVRAKRLCGSKYDPPWAELSVSAVVEQKGRVVIPSSIRKRLGIKEGMELEIDVKDGRILMRPKRKVSARDLLGMAGRERVDLNEVEESLASE